MLTKFTVQLVKLSVPFIIMKRIRNAYEKLARKSILYTSYEQAMARFQIEIQLGTL